MTTSTMRMTRPVSRYLLIAIPIAILAFLANPHGPLGGFWAPAAGTPLPTAAQLPFAMLLNLAEAVTFGGGIAFLLFGYEQVNGLVPASSLLTRAAHLSIAWLLINWFPHDNLHIHIGESDLGQLLLLEYIFHISLMVAGGVLAVFFSKVVRR